MDTVCLWILKQSACPLNNDISVIIRNVSSLSIKFVFKYCYLLRSEIEALKTKIKILEDENEGLQMNAGPSGAAGTSQADLGSPGIANKLAEATSGQMDIDMDLDSLSMVSRIYTGWLKKNSFSVLAGYPVKIYKKNYMTIYSI